MTGPRRVPAVLVTADSATLAGNLVMTGESMGPRGPA